MHSSRGKGRAAIVAKIEREIRFARNASARPRNPCITLSLRLAVIIRDQLTNLGRSFCLAIEVNRIPKNFFWNKAAIVCEIIYALFFRKCFASAVF